MKALEFTAAQQRSIVSRYQGSKRKSPESSISIARDFETSSNTILRVLRENKVKIRKVGRYATAS
jgi:hypothetical protein